jgi:hypothetical protein
MSFSRHLQASSPQMTRRTLVSASTSSQLSAWVLSPRACVNGLRICPNRQLHLCHRQGVLLAALAVVATAGQATVATPAIRLVQGHARALNLRLDVAEREVWTVRLRAPCHALVHAHHHIGRGEEATHVRLQLRGPDRLLDENGPEATQHLALLHPAAHDLQVIHAHHHHHVGETGVILPRQHGIAASAVLARLLAVVQGLRRTTPDLLRALRLAVAVIADHLLPVARGHCLHVAGILAPWKDLRRVRHLLRNQPSTIPWRISTLRVVA